MQKFARQPALILNLWPVYRPRLAPLGVGVRGAGLSFKVPPVLLWPFLSPPQGGRGQTFHRKPCQDLWTRGIWVQGSSKPGVIPRRGGSGCGMCVCVAGDGAEISSSPLPGRVSLRPSRGPAANKEPG